MDSTRSAALVGVAGGVGITRLAVETGALLAAVGRDVLVLDAAYATQGLSTYVDARLDPDVTTLASDPSLALADACHAIETPGDGALSVCPAHAPFARTAAASTAEAGERLGERLVAATERFDYVLADVPPVTTNPAVGVVTAADAVLAVTTGDGRGADALSRERGRLADVGTRLDAVVANRAGEDALADADVVVPDASLGPAADAPAVDPADPDAFTRAVASLVDVAFDLDVGLDEAPRTLADGLRRRLP